MRNLLLTAAFILTHLLQLHAGNTPSTSKLIVVENEKSMILNSPSYSNGAKVLTITDAFGEIIFSDVVEPNKKRIKYDLNALSTANYTIRVDDDRVTNIYVAEILNNKIEILETKSYYKPTIYNVEGKVVVRAELENKEDVRISIYDENQVLVFVQNIEKEASFVQSFNLDKLPKGQYDVQVSSEYFTDQISITL